TDLRGVALVLVACLLGVALPAAARAPAPLLGGLQGVGDRRAAASAVGAAPPGGSAAAGRERPGLARGCETPTPPVALALVRGAPGNVDPLASPARCSPLDLRGTDGAAADRRRDPSARAPPRARKPALGLPADRRRDQRARLESRRDDRPEDPARGGNRPCRR